MTHRCVNCGHEMVMYIAFQGGDNAYGELLECPVCGESWLDRNATPPPNEVVFYDVLGNAIGKVKIGNRKVKGA